MFKATLPYLGILNLFVSMTFLVACYEEYGFDSQVRQLVKVPSKFLTFWGNATNWSDFFIANVVVAFLLSAHAVSWSLVGFGWIFLIVAIVGALMLIPLLADSLKTPSAFFREDYLTLAGGMHYLLWTVQVSVILAFYLLTPRAYVTSMEVVIVTDALMAAWCIGVLHPPYKVHGEINQMAKVGATGGCVALIMCAVYLLYFTNR